MKEWHKVAMMLCTFGFLREIRPSEPYVSEFLLGEWRNITKDNLNKNVYPICTYSYLALLVLVFLVTDYLRYKPLIVVSGFCGVIIYSILLWTESIEWLQISQVVFGLYLATEVAYYTYMFAKVDKDRYERVAGWSRAAALAGKFVAGSTGQLLFSFKVMDIRQLNYLSLACQMLSCIWAVMLPTVERSIYFHREVVRPKDSADVLVATIPPEEKLKGLPLLWEHARSAYSRTPVLMWSIWYSASTTGYLLVQGYMQILWKDIDRERGNIYNGLMEAVITVISTMAALLAGRGLGWCGAVSQHRQRALLLLAAAVTAGQAAAVVACTLADTLWLCYSGYIVLSVSYHYIMTYASCEIARKLVYDSCFGLIFGINTLMGLAAQSALTFIIISESGLNLSLRGQYKVWSAFYVALCLLTLLAWAVIELKGNGDKKKNKENGNA